jgi:RimJ/RimL family protein N-acetyltransferase
VTPLLTERLVLRNWEDSDRDIFHLINSDEQVMAFYPYRRTRAESDEVFDTWRREIAETSLGGFALALRNGGDCIGYCGLKYPRVEPFLPEGTVEIGWRLAPPFWGKGYATEAAERSLEHGFETLGLPEIVSFAAETNNRSTAVMSRLGFGRDEAGDFDHPRVPDTHPHLKRHVLYRLSADDWRKRQRAV